MRVKIAVVAGLVVLAVAVGVVLSRSPLEVARVSVTSEEDEVLRTSDRARVCQGGELIPGHTDALQIAVSTESIGPRVAVEVLSGGRRLSIGTKDAGWRGTGITVPIRAVPTRIAAATVCISAGAHRELLTMLGESTSAVQGAYSSEGRLSAKVKIEYLRPGRRSWWSSLLPIARRLGLGRAAAGTWIAGAVLAAMGLAVILGSGVAVRELAGRE